MDLSAHNLPQAYVDFITAKDRLTNYYYKFNREDLDNPEAGVLYILSGTSLLERCTYDDSPDWQYLQNPEHIEFISGDIEALTEEDFSHSFVFGEESGDAGLLFFVPKEAIYIIYSDMYVKRIANSFEEFITYAILDFEKDMREFGVE